MGDPMETESRSLQSGKALLACAGLAGAAYLFFFDIGEDARRAWGGMLTMLAAAAMLADLLKRLYRDEGAPWLSVASVMLAVGALGAIGHSDILKVQRHGFPGSLFGTVGIIAVLGATTFLLIHAAVTDRLSPGAAALLIYAATVGLIILGVVCDV
ncbi:hypothetical protein [Patulibacter americanus]|uniref:hypothetical protein n=1 Tax=Patulibacter americanus TaxID=588672 RepID=UPI0003B3DBCB|nr:hypothetical protein [Patulibacter americanus]